MATIRSSILIKAGVQKVFDTLTSPDLIRLWQHGRILTTPWRQGGEIKFRTSWEGRIMEQWGKILDFRPNELIRYTLFTPAPGLEDKPENYCITSYVLSHEEGQTKVEIIQEDNRQGTFVGATLLPILTALKRVVETNP